MVDFSNVPAKFKSRFKEGYKFIDTKNETVDISIQNLVNYFVEDGQWNRRIYRCENSLYEVSYNLYTMMASNQKIPAKNLCLENPEKFVTFVDDYIRQQFKKYDSCVKVGTMEENAVREIIGMELIETTENILFREKEKI